MEDLLERFRLENARLRQEIKDLLPTSLVPCPVCGISGVRPGDKMCDKCRIERLNEIAGLALDIHTRDTVYVTEKWGYYGPEADELLVAKIEALKGAKDGEVKRPG